MEEECSADKNLYEAYLGYKEARDTLNQVRRGRGFWPVIAIPAPPIVVQQRWLCGTMMSHSESKEETARATPTRVRAKGTKMEKSGKKKGGKGKSSGKRPVKGKGDPLKQRLVSRTQCRLCGEECHWEEDMPQAKRRVTFFQTSCGYWCHSKPGVLKRGRLRRLQKVLKIDSNCGLLKKFKRARTSWVSP